MTKAKKETAESRSNLVHRSEELIGAWDKESHDRAAADHKGSTIAGYSEAELRQMLRDNGSVPAGVSYSPYSTTPFAPVPDSLHDDLAEMQAQVDATGRGAVAGTGGAADGMGTGATGGGGVTTSTGGGGGVSGSTGS